MNGKRPSPPGVEGLLHYFASLHDPVQQGQATPALPSEVDLVPLMPDQFMYALNYQRNTLFMAHGFARVLGYPDHEMDFASVFDYIHPDDAAAVTAIVEPAVKQAIQESRIVPFASVMSVDYHIRNANGTYIKILRQVTALEIEPLTGRMISTLSICKDISNIKQSNVIGWQGFGPGIEHMDMSDLVGSHPNVLYRPSPRELEILALIALGKSSKLIAAELDIRVHTVNTHRKDLLQRTGLKNTAQIIRQAHNHNWH